MLTAALVGTAGFLVSLVLFLTGISKQFGVRIPVIQWLLDSVYAFASSQQSAFWTRPVDRQQIASTLALLGSLGFFVFGLVGAIGWLG